MNYVLVAQLPNEVDIYDEKLSNFIVQHPEMVKSTWQNDKFTLYRLLKVN